MDPFTLAAAGVSTVGNLIGGFLNRGAADKANEAAIDNALRQADLQREFAKNSIRWRVEDAKAAGIHPLAALGNPGISYSPISVGTAADTSMGTMASNMGQDISRAINATRTQTERDKAFAEGMRELDAERKVLENELIRSQIARMNQSSQPAMPGSPSPGQMPGQGSNVRVIHELTQGGTESSIPDVGVTDTTAGRRAVIPGKQIKDQIEDMSWYPFQHFMRNAVMPFFDKSRYPKLGPNKPGHEWAFNPLTGEYYERRAYNYVPHEVDHYFSPRARKGFMY